MPATLRAPVLLACLFAVLALGTPAAADHDPERVARVGGETRIDTAVAVSRQGWDRAGTAVVATARAFPDALAAAPLAASLDAPLLLAEPDRLPAAVAAELQRLRAHEVLVVGGSAAVGEPVEAELAGVPGVETVRRLAGADRFATAALVAAEVGAAGGEVTVASGQAFPDALAAAALPGRRAQASDSTERRYASADAPRPPVLLVRQGSLPDATAEALDALQPAVATILGGVQAVGEDVERRLADRVAEVGRLAGADRYATARAALAEAQRRGAAGPVVAATGQAFPDALGAGALTARLGGLLALTPSSRLPDDLDRAVRDAPSDAALVVGGRNAVGPHVRSELDAALAGTPRPFATVVSAAGFRGVARPLPADVAEDMRGTSWEAGCPVGLGDLALLSLPYHGLDGTVGHGEMVVLDRVAPGTLRVFARIFDARFPVERMERIDAFDGDDDASMAANNTSGFNCRTVAGTGRWSEHARGTAIDLNPVQNPFRRGRDVQPDAGRAYLDRADVRPGMIVRPGPVVEAFEAIGWGWGGDWATADDWMHFSESGG